MLTQEKTNFIEFMLQSDVLRFGEFKTKSGRLSPYFINTGNYRTGAQIDSLGRFYASLVKESVGDGFDALFGPAYKGIPLAAAAAGSLYRDFGIDKPYFFNRKEVKDHGEGGNLIGYQPKDGDRVMIIEDVITAGTAVRETLPVLKGAAAVEVAHMFISVNRSEVGMDTDKTAAQQILEEFGIQVHALVSVFDLREYLAEKAASSEAGPDRAMMLEKMDDYMQRYCRR